MADEKPTDYPARLRAALAVMQKQQATIARLESSQSEPIAVIGIGCRFPGGADDPESFWRLLRDGVDAIREVPADRWPIDDYFDPNPDAPGKMATRWGGFLTDVDRFDARFFRISPREAMAMDPQQRLLLEVSWTALEHAAIDPTALGGTQTGVFVGLTTLDYAKVIYRDEFARLDAYCATGNVANVASGRLSYFYGLRGPSLTVDTACSSSLVALHLACQSLRTGESDLALAAGVNLILAPDGSIAVSRAHMLSPDGRCKTFDRSADGYARSEGCGVVVLKRWSNAIADHDPIVAIIRGSAVRQDGARSGLTVPNGPAQEAVIRAALQAARVKPAEVSYVEAHGTGTSLGDPIEVEALGHVFTQGRPSTHPLVIGALKTNVGHMESAAGVGGIIKTALALQHGEIPRHLHLRTIHADIALDEIPAVVPTAHLPWPAGYERRIAGVSSFGSSGTVAHVVLEAPAPSAVPHDEGPVGDGRLPWLLPLSAGTPRALGRMRERYEAFLEISGEAFGNICHTASVGRAHLACRLAVIATNRDEALARLRERAGEPIRAGSDSARPEPVFLCSGDGPLPAGAGRRLYDTVPAFRAAIDTCDRLMAGQLPAPLRDLVADETAHQEDIVVAHAARFALGYAVACAWRAWGIEPAIVAGQGLGEYVAASIAGVFSIEDAVRLVRARATAIRDAQTSSSPGSSLSAFRAALESVAFRAPRMKLVTDGTGVSAGTTYGTPAYWLSGARQPGPPAASMAAIAAGLAANDEPSAPRAFLEIGPSLAFAGARGNVQALWLQTLTPARDELLQMLDSAARLYEAGHDLRWGALAEGRTAVRVAAPTYAFERDRYWPERPAAIASQPALPRPAARYPQAQRAPSAAVAADRARPDADRTLRLGVMFFNGSEAATPSENYRLVLEAARFADTQGLSSVWIPERHFTAFGSLYPNPATLHAALARETSHVRLMAGSVVMPLHNPLRLTEEWSVVDNLSGGRVGMSFASGWNPDDFALNPQAYADRQETLFRGIEDVRRLWRGESIEVIGGTGKAVRLRTYPAPVQRELPLWVTAASNPRTFERAGAIGANLLTHLLDHDVEELAGKVSAYRRERAAHGHDPEAGQVTVMLHTFLGEDIASVHALVREPYCRYLKENIHLLKGLAVHRGSQVDVTTLSAADLDGFVGFLYDRFHATRALLGTVDSCLPLLERLSAIGIDEIACLLDFGPSTDDVLASLPYLRDLAARAARIEPPTPHRPTRVSTAIEPRDLLDHAYDIRWSPIPAASQADGERRRTLVIGDKGEVGTALVGQLNAIGSRATLVDPTDVRYDDLPDADDLVYLKHLDARPDADPTIGLTDAVQLVQSMARAQRVSKLWFVTRASQRVLPTDRPSPAQAALWAMVKVLPIEMARMWGGIIDVEAGTPAAMAARHLVAALTAEAGEDQIAIRDGRLHAARLALVDVVRSAAWSLPPDATYLITGGLRGLGLEAARWLARHGARHLSLIGRSPAAERRTPDVLRELARDGVDVRTAAVDVGDREALAAVLDIERRAGRPPVRGVVHAAGVWNDRPLVDLSAEELAAVLAPKVSGTLALADVLPSLDLFIGFSAFSALLPAESQGNYAAANAFLDAFLRSRADGRPGWTSVNWGPWSEIGFAATPYGARAHARLETLGISRIAPREGFATLDALVNGSQTGLGIMPVDWRRLFDRDPNARLSPLLRDLNRQFGSVAHAGGAGRLRDLLAGLGGVDEIGCLERELTTMAAGILRLPPREIGRSTSFADLGVDSLMAVELKNHIQHEAGVDLPLVKLLEGPSIADLAVLVAAHIKVTGLRRVSGVPAGEHLKEIEI